MQSGWSDEWFMLQIVGVNQHTEGAGQTQAGGDQTAEHHIRSAPESLVINTWWHYYRSGPGVWQWVREWRRHETWRRGGGGAADQHQARRPASRVTPGGGLCGLLPAAWTVPPPLMTIEIIIFFIGFKEGERLLWGALKCTQHCHNIPRAKLLIVHSTFEPRCPFTL